MKNGADTKVWARIDRDRRERDARSRGRLERRRQQARAGRTRAAGRGRPPTAAGRSAGRRSPRAKPLPAERPAGKDERQRQAQGRRSCTRLIAVVTRLSQRASRTTGERERVRQRPIEDRPHDEGERPAAPRKSAKSAGDRVERAIAPTARPRARDRRAAGPVRAVRGGMLAAAPSITTAAGTRSRRGSPGRPARRTRSRNALAAAAFFDALTTTPAYVAGTFAVSGTSIVVTLVDALASVT